MFGRIEAAYNSFLLVFVTKKFMATCYRLEIVSILILLPLKQ